ncbi:MAG: HAMP domain-containing sensor histidine kinase [Bacteroidota bacterium]
MNTITDQELLNELKKRIEQNQNSLTELRNLSEQLLDLNKKLEESEKLKSHFISNIRNEIINPFSSIIELSKHLANNDKIEREKVVLYSNLIFNEAFHLNFQMKNIFAAAEIEAGESAPQLSKVNIVGILEDAKNYYLDVATHKEISIVFNNSITDENQILINDAEKLQLIFSNLINNAINFSEKNTQITIESSFSNNTFIIDIKDQGIGIAEENKKMIFDRFVRIDSRINSLNSGYGLGLTISNDLAYILNGTIDVFSELGKGSTFRLTLPSTFINGEESDVALSGNEFLFENDMELF